jgi:hypothetical protein
VITVGLGTGKNDIIAGTVQSLQIAKGRKSPFSLAWLEEFIQQSPGQSVFPQGVNHRMGLPGPYPVFPDSIGHQFLQGGIKGLTSRKIERVRVDGQYIKVETVHLEPGQKLHITHGGWIEQRRIAVENGKYLHNSSASV